MTKSAKFQRAGSGSAKNKSDHRGSVAVSVNLRALNGATGYLKGNIGRALTVKGAKVSEVFAAIERALFGAKP